MAAKENNSIFKLLCDRLFIHFRRRRMHRFYQLFPLSRDSRVLDIGGTRQTWQNESAVQFPVTPQFPVTLLNILDYGMTENPRFTAVQGDAAKLPFADSTFELAFSNSVIEHVGDWQKQLAFASEARRVATKLWIQTPARSFPIEAHLLAPYIQYLPKKLQHRLARWFTPRGWMQPDAVHQIVDEVRLLTYKEMTQLFPDCIILRERFLGLSKSYIAIRGYSPVS